MCYIVPALAISQLHSLPQLNKGRISTGVRGAEEHSFFELEVDWTENMVTPQKEVQKRYQQDQKRYQRQIEKNKKILAKYKAA